MPAKLTPKIIYAHAHRSGLISFNDAPIPDGLLLMKGPAKRVRDLVAARARHGYKGGVLLVPGLPEADTEFEAISAVRQFREFLSR